MNENLSIQNRNKIVQKLSKELGQNETKNEMPEILLPQ